MWLCNPPWYISETVSLNESINYVWQWWEKVLNFQISAHTTHMTRQKWSRLLCLFLDKMFIFYLKLQAGMRKGAIDRFYMMVRGGHYHATLFGVSGTLPSYYSWFLDQHIPHTKHRSSIGQGPVQSRHLCVLTRPETLRHLQDIATPSNQCHQTLGYFSISVLHLAVQL